MVWIKHGSSSSDFDWWMHLTASFARATFENGQYFGGIDHHAAVIFGFDEQLPGQNLLRQHAGAPARSDDVRAQGGQLFLQRLIRIVFITRAAFQSTAAPRDLRGV